MRLIFFRMINRRQYEYLCVHCVTQFHNIIRFGFAKPEFQTQNTYSVSYIHNCEQHKLLNLNVHGYKFTSYCLLVLFVYYYVKLCSSFEIFKRIRNVFLLSRY